MNDDLLRQLAEVAIEDEKKMRARLDERWDRLSAGTLSRDEEEALAALAEESEEAREAYAAFQPFDAAFHSRVVRAVQARRSDAGPSSPARPRRPARVLPFGRRVRRAGGWLGAAAALAALVVLSVRGPAHDLPPLAEYVLEIEGDQEIRSEGSGPSTAVPVFAPGSLFELVLRPRTETTGGVDVRCFLQRHGRPRPWEVDAEIHPSGSVRIAGIVGQEIDIDPGEWTLWVLVARLGKLPGAGELRPFLGTREARGPDWVLLRRTIRIEEKGP